MKKVISVISVLLVLMLGFVLTLKTTKAQALEDAKLFAKLNVANEDINSDSVCLDPYYSCSLDTNTAGLGPTITLKQAIPLAGSDGFIVRIKNLDNNAVLTRMLIRTSNDDGYTPTQSVVTFYDMEGNKTLSDKPSNRGLLIPASFDGVMVIEWSEMVPFRKNKTDDWTNLANTSNKLVKGSEGNTAFPSDNLTSIALRVEKSAAHATVNPIVLSNVYTYSYADEDYTVIKYNNPWLDSGSNDDGALFKYPTTASTILEALGEAGRALDSGAVCVDPLDPVADSSNVSGVGGTIVLKSQFYFGNSDGIVFRIKNPTDVELTTRIYISTTDGTNGIKSQYTLNNATVMFVNLDGTIRQRTDSGRPVTIYANFDGYMVLPWNQFTAYNYNGTTNWGAATDANKLVRGGEGQKAYPVGSIRNIEFYIHQKDSHTTANIDPFILGDLFAYTQGESSYTIIRKEDPFSSSVSGTASGKLDVYAYPTTKQTYNYTIDGVATLESDNAKILSADQGMEVAYGNRFSIIVTPKDGASIVKTTIDGVDFNVENPIVNLTREAATHTINVVTARETLYSLVVTGNFDRFTAKVNDSAYTTSQNIAENTTVEVELTPKTGFYLNKVLVNGEAVTLVDGKYTFNITNNSTVQVDAQYAYNEFNNPALINSQLNGEAMVFDPNIGADKNQGGHIYTRKNMTLAGTDGIAFRVKNLENTDYIVDTIFLQLTNNWGYSLYDATIKYIALDGTVTENSMSARQVKIPANFDGYMLIEYSQLVTIRTGGSSWDWSKNGSNKISKSDYPVESLLSLDLYFPKQCEGINELVLGTDVYTLTYDGNNVTIKQYLDSLTITGNSMANTVSVKNYPAGTVAVTCDNTNVTLEKSSYIYGETVKITPKDGYTIVSAKFGADDMVDDGTGSFVIRISKAYDANIAITVEATQLTYYNVTVNFNANHANVSVQDTPYTAIAKFVEGSHVVVEISVKEGFVIESVTLNGAQAQLAEGKLEFDLTADATISVETQYAYTLLSKFENAQSELTNNSIVFDPVATEGGQNQGGTISFAKAASLKGADAIAFRVKNLESYNYDIHTFYLHLTNNWSYSLMSAKIKFVALDGTATEATFSRRAITIPANFDGYMIIEFTELVPIKTGGSDWIWTLGDSDKIAKADFPVESLSTIGIFFPFSDVNAKANELVFGNDVFTIVHGEDGDTIKQFSNALKMEGHTVVSTVKVSNYIVFESNLACENQNVEVNLTKFHYGDTITVTPKAGYIIESTAMGDEAFTKGEDGVYSFKVTKAYGENMTLTVVATSVTVVTFNVGENVETSLDTNELKLGEGNTTVEFTLTFTTGYEVDYVKVNGTTLEAQNGIYIFNATQDSTVEIRAKLTEYTITYNLDGGTNNANNKAIFTVNDSFALLDPTKEGYEFLGWYVIAEGDAHEDIVRVPAGTAKNLVVYALWEKVETPVDPVTQAPTTQAPTTQAPTTQAPKTTTKAPDTTTVEPAQTGKKKGCKNALVPSILGVAFLLGSIVVIKRKREE